MRKVRYIPSGNQESFIVPALLREISTALHDIALELVVDQHATEALALDCGCGDQPFKKLIKQQGFQYESLDVAQNSTHSVDYVVAVDCPRAQFSKIIKKRYSLVFVTEVMEHVSDWPAAFVNIASCVMPGGYALFTAPFFYPLHEEPFDYCRPTLHQFEKLAKINGFEVRLAKKIGDAVDIIGTTLGATRISYSSAPAPSIFSKIINRLLLGLQKVVFKLLVRHRNRFSSDCSTIYLSNLVVLKKVSV